MATIEEVLKTDIAHRSDYVLSATGDLEIVSGLANIKEALFHRLMTSPGSLVHRPTYGVGILNFQNSIANITTHQNLALRIKEQFEEDSRVLEVLGVAVNVDDDTPEKAVIVVRVKIAGYDEVVASFIPFGGGGVS